LSLQVAPASCRLDGGHLARHFAFVPPPEIAQQRGGQRFDWSASVPLAMNARRSPLQSHFYFGFGSRNLINHKNLQNREPQVMFNVQGIKVNAPISDQA